LRVRRVNAVARLVLPTRKPPWLPADDLRCDQRDQHRGEPPPAEYSFLLAPPDAFDVGAHDPVWGFTLCRPCWDLALTWRHDGDGLAWGKHGAAVALIGMSGGTPTAEDVRAVGAELHAVPTAADVGVELAPLGVYFEWRPAGAAGIRPCPTCRPDEHQAARREYGDAP
jgi:hypothetical protein